MQKVEGRWKTCPKCRRKRGRECRRSRGKEGEKER